MRVVLASSNPGKAAEVSAILAGTAIEVVMLDVWTGDLENGVSYLENARLKAMAVMRSAMEPVLAEDSGIEVDALGGLPGLHSARFAGPAAGAVENNAKLLRLLNGVPERTCRYRATAVLLLPSGAEFLGAGTWEGSVASAPKGDGGFGYDPVFIPDGSTRTGAELGASEKNAVSHRAQALLAIARQLGSGT